MRFVGHMAAFLVLTGGCFEPEPPPPAGAAVIKWRNADVRGESVPVVGDSAVYHLEQETHIVSAVRKSDGSVLWKRTLPVTNPNFDGYGLRLSGNVLVVGDLDLFGVDPATGSILWKYQQSQGSNPGFGRLTVADGVVYCGSTSGHIFAVDAATGVEKWVVRHMPTTSSIYDPVIVGGVVYAGFTDFTSPPRGGALAVDAATGALRWTAYAPVPSAVTPTDNTAGVVVFGDKAFFGSGTGVHAVDRVTGAALAPLPSGLFGTVSFTPHRPFGVGDLLLVSSFGLVTAVDPITYERKWQVGTTSSVISLNGDGQLVYVPQHGAFSAVYLATGKQAWRYTATRVGGVLESFLAAPAVEDSLVFVPGSQNVYAFKRLP